MESNIVQSSDFSSYSLFRSIGSEPRHLWSHQKTNQTSSDKMDTDLDQLFVFGYSCKLFRDDRRAQELDAGHHLIGWNGSSDHLIDRFDVRGYLNDLTQFQTNQKSCGPDLTEEELEIERLCDEERFADLKYDDLDDTHDEELKRLHLALADGSGYNQISYNYDENNVVPISNPEVSEQTPDIDESDRFKLPSGLLPPENIVLPESQKLHNIIEKTASFVSQHGIQMEIILKTKQSSNKNFDFLSFDSQLYPYYKFILENIKTGKYTPKETQNSDNSSDSEDNSDDDHYLHPSLLGSSKSRESNTFKIPNLLRTSNTDDSYSQLVKHFKDRFPVTEEIPTEETPKPVSEQITKQIICVNSEIFRNQNTNKDKILNTNVSQNSWSSLLPSPPPEIEKIIEKLAQRVAQNGEQFELSIRKLGETRFEFVNPGHIYHAHYIRRKLHYLEENRSAQAAQLKLNNKRQPKAETHSNKTPVSFSISTKDSKHSIGATDENLLTTGSSKREDERNFDPELIAKRMSDNALKDKLALAVRDRAAKEKQEERKRKAAVFLSLLKNKSKEVTKNVNQSVCEQLSKQSQSTDSAPLSPTIAAVTSPNASPEIDKRFSNESLIFESTNKGMESAKSGSILPFIASDKPLKVSSSRHSSPQRHHKSRHSSDHKKSLKKKKSRSKSRSRSSSRSPSHSYRKHSKRLSKSRSRSRSRSHSRSHRRH